MDRDKHDQSSWSRRDVFRMGGLATAVGVFGGADAADASSLAQARAIQGAEVYTRIGVRPFINLTGTYTINGGALSLPEVRDAEHQAAGFAVNLDELMERVGARIAELMGCEGAIVTGGASAALTHATAACIAGADPELIQQLPDLRGLKDEVIIPRESRNVYDQAFRGLGVRMVEVDTQAAFHAALGPRTAMVAVLGTGEARGPLRLEEMAAAARKAAVPVVVDAAAELPQRPNPYLTRGADLVAYSGGKVIRGPQCAGLLLGRKDLVWAAFMNSAPHHSFGRPMKVGKEEIMGMLTAVEMLMARGIEVDYRLWRAWLQEISDILTRLPGVRTEMNDPAGASPFPTMMVEWDPARNGITAGEVHAQLMDGDPRIQSHASGDVYSFRIRPTAMRPGDAALAGRRIAEVLAKAPAGITEKALAPPVADLSGRWEVDVEYTRGKARHRLFLAVKGNKLEGTHTGRSLDGPLSGTVDGDRVRMRSNLPYEGSGVAFVFEGQAAEQSMQGEVSLGEYGTARWTARRLKTGEA
jgi:L-seryl-tRNA(Ser) seleniumtransferase